MQDHKKKFINCLHELNYIIASPIKLLTARVKQNILEDMMPNRTVTWIRPHSFNVRVKLNENPKKHINNYSTVDCKYGFKYNSDVYFPVEHSIDEKIVEIYIIEKIGHLVSYIKKNNDKDEDDEEDEEDEDEKDEDEIEYPSINSLLLENRSCGDTFYRSLKNIIMRLDKPTIKKLISELIWEC